MIGTKPYAALQYRNVNGRRMAYIDKGAGDAIVLQHGQPASSYVWRNIMPHLEGLGRLIACDLIGMGGSEKLSPSGPDRYQYTEHRDYLFALWDALDLGDRVVLMLDDWGATLGFDWANQHRDRVRGIVHMEAVAIPLNWSDIVAQSRPFFRALRSPDGERMVLEENIFIESRLPGAVLRQLTDEEMAHYRQPFRNPGEDRRPPFGPAHMTQVLPQVSCCVSCGVIQHPLPEEIQLHPAIPTPLDQLQAVDMPLDRPVRPGKGQGGFDGSIVPLEHVDEVP